MSAEHAPRPSVSVVIPTYNDAAHLGDALRSIVEQTLPPTEIVICDDGSEDGTGELVRDFSAQRAGGVDVRYVRLPGRSGSASARNRGVAEAQGEWIAVCDSDDMWAPGKLERQLGFIGAWRGRRPLAVLGAHGWNVNEAGRIISLAPIGPTSEEEYERAREEGSKVVMLHSSLIYPRAQFDAIGGYSSEYGTLDDVDFVCRMVFQGAVICVPEPLVYYRKRGGSKQLADFWTQRMDARRLTANQYRRAHGEDPLTAEQFTARLAAAPARERLRRRRKILGLYNYRLGATDVVNGRRVRGVLRLALAAVLDGTRLRLGAQRALRSRLPSLAGHGDTRRELPADDVDA